MVWKKSGKSLEFCSQKSVRTLGIFSGKLFLDVKNSVHNIGQPITRRASGFTSVFSQSRLAIPFDFRLLLKQC